MNAYAHGWYQLAFERDIEAPVSPLQFGALQLIAVRTEAGLRVFDAACPHRGAHLGYGSRPATGDSLVCGFHGYRIGLGRASSEGFCLREYASLVRDGLLFFRLSDLDTPDFPAAFAAITEGHRVVPGFEMSARTTIEVVMENGFDNAHFRSVHGLLNIPALQTRPGDFAELYAEGDLDIPRSGWRESPGGAGEQLRPRYVAHAYSPGLVITELRGAPPFHYRIMTTATPTADPAVSAVRLTLILPESGDGPEADAAFAEELLKHSRAGLEQDRAIWDRLDLAHRPQLTRNDDAVVAFGEFCRRFRREAA